MYGYQTVNQAKKLGFSIAHHFRRRQALGVGAPPGAAESCLLLAKAATPVQQQSIGAQAGGRVFLCTDDFWRDYHDMRARGVAFAESPQQEGYGTVAVFQDLYGNRWDLLQLKSNTTTSTL